MKTKQTREDELGEHVAELDFVSNSPCVSESGNMYDMPSDIDELGQKNSTN